MVEPDRRPSAQEIDELTELVRRDPSSPAFIDLGEAYLALGRPKEALEIGAVGLQADPDSMEGRVMVARAHIALHQWKEGQAELLKVVKVDRSNKAGFALLGEVLLRRSDYERAVPVLQHAQNLDPTSGHVLALLRRARAGQALDPPPPVPLPQQPRGANRGGGGRAAPAVAPQPRHSAQRSAPVPQFDDLDEPPPRLLDQAPRGGGRRSAGRPSAHAPTAPAPSMPEPPRRSAHRPAAAPLDHDREPVRPRVVAATKPRDAAREALRQSAAVGENYLNDLLTGGLLDVAGVRVPEVEYDLRPDRRWGRSTTRMFVGLFILMFLGLGGGGFYWWYTEKEKAEAVAKGHKEAKAKIVNGSFEGLEAGLASLKTALEKDPDSTLTMAYIIEVAGIETLLYGTDPERVDIALKQAGRDFTKPSQEGFREIMIGRAAVNLSRLGRLDPPGAITTLQDVNASLDQWLAAHGDDRWARWLKGRALIAGGKRQQGIAMLKQAADGQGGLVVALIDQADLLVDDGKLADAMKLYEQALTVEKDHPLALLGRALARAESGVQSAEAMDDLSVKLSKPLGPRVAAYAQLATAFAKYALEDYPGFRQGLAAATSGQLTPTEPRFLVRIAMANLFAGDLAAAARARGGVKWISKEEPERDPSAHLVDIGLLVASGLPERALEEASKLEGVRARIFRVQSLLDLANYKEALSEANELKDLAPDNIEVQILREWARVVANSGGEREAASTELEKVARKAKTKFGRHAQGMAAMATGNAGEAKNRLEQALKDIAEDAPHPVVYRTHTALARLALAADPPDIEGAAKQLDDALKANAGYQPANVLAAKISLIGREPARALEFLANVYRDEKNGAVTPEVKLLQAEALATSPDANAKTRAEAKALLVSIKGKVDADELGRVAAMVDDDLPGDLGVPKPRGSDDGGSRRKKR